MTPEKLFFQISRFVFLVLAAVTLVGVVFSVFLYTLRTAQATQDHRTVPPRPEVSATDIKQKLVPFAPASASTTAPTPFGRAASPLTKMKEKYPSVSNIWELMQLFGYGSQADCDAVTNCIDEAEETVKELAGAGAARDEAAAYVDNAITVLTPIKASDRRAAFSVYHNERMRLLTSWASEVKSQVAADIVRKAEAERQALKAIIIAAGAFVTFLLTCQLLAILAIERNTRAR
ncbi:MAG: hypothetical protein WC789_05860 [Lentisphaeria bacterium]|jgi:hypothetical protein